MPYKPLPASDLSGHLVIAKDALRSMSCKPGGGATWAGTPLGQPIIFANA